MPESDSSANKRERLLRILGQGLEEFYKEHSASPTPCPTSSTMVDYVLGHLSYKESQVVNRHIVFCDACFDDFLALLGPEGVQRLLDGERVISLRDFNEDLLSKQVAMRRRKIDVDINAIQIVGESSGFAIRKVERPSSRIKIVEVAIGENKYTIELIKRDDTDLERCLIREVISCDIKGYSTNRRVPLRITLGSEAGKEIVSTHTNLSGSASFVLTSEDLSSREYTMRLGLEDVNTRHERGVG